MTAYIQTDCRPCTLSSLMRDCSACRFFAGQPLEERTPKYYPLATSADVFRMYRELRRDLTPDELKAVPMALDYTQSATI